jgi:transcriptional regulator with XRE-family HTH domain
MFDQCAIMSLSMDEISQARLSKFLFETLKSQQLSMTALAKRAHVSKQVISKYINQPPAQPDKNVLKGIADALDIPDVEIFRIAGILDPVSDETSQRNELNFLITKLTPEDLQEVIDYARHRLEKQETKSGAKKQTSRRGTPARNALIEQ